MELAERGGIGRQETGQLDMIKSQGTVDSGKWNHQKFIKHGSGSERKEEKDK